MLAQTFRDFELILVDDGSPDRCPEICDEYAAKDSRIVVIHQQNSGVSAARNAGLDIARGKYIGFIDPDDWIEPNMYAELVANIERYNADLAVCGHKYCDKNYNQLSEERQPLFIPDKYMSQMELMKHVMDLPPTVGVAVFNKLYVADLLKNIRFIIGLSFAEDALFINEYIKVIRNAVCVGKRLYNQLLRDDGLCKTGNSGIKACEAAFWSNKVLYDSIVSAYPCLKNHSLAFVLDRCLLKYSTIRQQLAPEQNINSDALKNMRNYILSMGRKAIFCKEIYWKTRIIYLCGLFNSTNGNFIKCLLRQIYTS